MALWGLSVADRPLEAEGKTVVMRFICVAGREMVNAGHETSMAKHDFSISGFETIANAVAAENCRYGIHFIPNRSLEKVSCHFLMTAIRKIALYMLDS